MVAAGYALLALVYIVASDRVVALVAPDAETIIRHGTIKGVAFVAVTSAGLFAIWFLLARGTGRERASRIATQRRLDDLGDAVPNPLLVIAPDGRLLDWNAAMVTASGYSSDRLARMTLADLAHHEDLAPAVAAIARIIDTGLPERADARLATASGAVQFYRWHGAALRDPRGRIDAVAVVGVDLTDLMSMQDQLQRSLLDARQVLRQTVDALAMAVEKRDPFTSGHERRVAALSLAIADAMGLPAEERDGLEYAALLHDIGNLAIPSDILTKPGLLTPSERDLVQAHAGDGYEILAPVRFPWPVAEIIRQHHARLDGSGYPKIGNGEPILREAMILGVADVVEAMCSHRPYRPALGSAAALAEIREGSGTRYDSQVVAACERVFSDGFEFPAASR